VLSSLTRPLLLVWQGSLSLRSVVLHPTTCTHVRLLGPCFKTGQWAPRLSLYPLYWLCELTAFRHSTRTQTELCRQLPQGRILSCTAGAAELNASSSAISSILTLFSKFFSSFLHSTCSLSVSCEYLALEEVYLPIRAAIPSYPTR
jgi:hypothetical protein